MTIKVKYLADILPIEIFETGDWVDLRCAEDTWVKMGEYCEISLGIAMELPEGYEAHVVPRSSTFKKYGIISANSVGIIDNSFCGPEDCWHFLAYATRDAVIRKNERICQFRVFKNSPPIEIEEVEELKNPNRKGIGSTGDV